NIQDFEIDLGAAGAQLTVLSTSASTKVVGGAGDDTVSVGDSPFGGGGNLDNILGPLTVVGGGGSDRLFVHDGGAPGAFNYQVAPTSVTNDPATLATVPIPTTPPARTFAGI